MTSIKMADKQFDVSPQELKLLQEKAARRLTLRKEFLKQVSNPYKHAVGEGGTVFDSGIQRFLALKATGYDHFRPTTRSFINGMVFLILPIVGYTYLLKRDRDAKEHMYRTGQVAYKDRRFKWI